MEASRKKVDLLVADYLLPGISGVELMRKIRARNPELKVILISGMTDRKSRSDMLGAGAQAIFAKLADVFLSQALRTYLAGAEQAGLLSARQTVDPQIGQALAALHDRPAVNWTLAELACLSGMSRTLFAARFRAAVGESPMRHLAKIRLGQAAGYLTTTRLSVEAIARRTGYGTDASLSKAFKREFGTSPGRYRENRGTIEVLQAVDQ